MEKINKIILLTMTILIVAVVLAACTSAVYEDYTPAIVVTTVEYDGEPVTLGCKGDFRCEKETLDCVYHYHKLAQNHIDRVKSLLQMGKEDIPIITELYGALCNIYEAQARIDILEGESLEDWQILEKTGFIKQTKIVSSILILKIRQMENRSNF